MADINDGRPPTLADLDARLREVEALQDLILRRLSTTKPLDGVLEHSGATDTQERAFYRALRIGLVDAVVIATAIRLKARDCDPRRPAFHSDSDSGKSHADSARPEELTIKNSELRIRVALHAAE